ncbi:mitochondrial resolvase Ydc2, partial [Apiosordaria backusii]
MTTTKLTLPGKITVAHLQALCSSTGLPQAGSKSVIQQNLRQAAQSVQHIPDNARILSIDLGLKNFAFSLLTPAPSPSKTTPLPVPSDIQTTSQALLPPINLHTWNHLDLTTPLPSQNDTSPSTSPPEPIQFTPTSLSSLTYSLISNYLLPLKPTHILIERQRFRTGNASNIFEWTIRVNTLEAMLHACFATLKGVNLFNGTVISISPKTVAGYLFPNPGKTSSEETETGKRKTLNPYQIMKANKVSMLGEWLQQGKLIKPKEQGAEMAHGFLSAWKAKGTRKKKGEEVLGPGVKLDDLSDSVLQGMVWLQWQRNLEGL